MYAPQAKKLVIVTGWYVVVKYIYLHLWFSINKINGDKDKYQSRDKFAKYYIQEDQVGGEKKYDYINEIYPNDSCQY